LKSSAAAERRLKLPLTEAVRKTSGTLNSTGISGVSRTYEKF
jgi:hypothetical protein